MFYSHPKLSTATDRAPVPDRPTSPASGWRSTLSSLAILLLLGTPGEAEIRFVPLDTADVQASLAAARATQPHPEGLIGPGNVLLLPYFEIGPGADPNTTHLGVRNNLLASDTTVDITYYDRFGNASTIENGITIPPSGVYTRNLSQVPGLPVDPDGIKRGFAFVAGPTLLSGEYFQLDPQNAFATGSRLISNGDLCFVSDARFIQGGPFTGGTHFQLYVNIPLGVQPGDPPSASFTIANEAGLVFGNVGIQTDQVVNEFPVGDLLAALPAGNLPGGAGPNFGSVFVIHSASAGYGLLSTTYSALGQYSVGMSASCETPAP